MEMVSEFDRSSLSYYNVLGVGVDSSEDDIRRAYHKLAMRWHPDRWTRNPSLMSEAKRKFQEIQEAYSVLSDKRKRTMYDAGLYDPFDEDDEGLADFLQELMSYMADVRREDKFYSMNELQNMFTEMARGFEFPKWPDSLQWRGCAPLAFDDRRSSKRAFDDSRSSKRARCKRNPEGSPYLQMQGLGMYGTRNFCS